MHMTNNWYLNCSNKKTMGKWPKKVNDFRPSSGDFGLI